MSPSSGIFDAASHVRQSSTHFPVLLIRILWTLSLLAFGVWRSSVFALGFAVFECASLARLGEVDCLKAKSLNSSCNLSLHDCAWRSPLLI